jgi:hypothetical protein
VFSLISEQIPTVSSQNTREVNSSIDSAIHEWIMNHPNHVEEYDLNLKTDSTENVIRKLLSNPESVREYEDIINFQMNGK